jgi:hypothetical protein
MRTRRRAAAIRPDRVMRTPTIIRVLAAGLLAAGALAVAACGSDDGTGGASSTADRQREARNAALRYARCMREHGVDVPDPTFQGGGINQTGPEEKVPKAKLQEAEQACEKYTKDVDDGPKLSEEQQEEFKDAALANARCMREHGIENFPDPTFSGDGEAEIKAPEGAFDPNDPDFKEAEKACKDTMPKPPSQETAP